MRILMVAEIKNNLPAVVFMVPALVSVDRKFPFVVYCKHWHILLVCDLDIVDTVYEYMLVLILLQPWKHLPLS